MRKTLPSIARRKRTGAALAVVLCALAIGGALARAQLSTEDFKFANYLIHELKYFDTAQRLLDSLRSSYANNKLARGDIAYLEFDMLQLNDKQQAAIAKAEENKRLYPDHPRSALSSLPKITRDMTEVLGMFREASRLPPAKAALSRKKARELFSESIARPLDSLIVELSKRVVELEKQYSKAVAKNPEATRPKKLHALRRDRNNMELIRVKFHRIFGRQIPATSDENKAERKGIFEKALAYAKAFVSDRAELFLMQYEAQLQRGLCEIELERYTDAYDSLELLVELRAPRNAGGDVVAALRTIKIKAILFSSQAANEAGLFAKAAALVDKELLNSKDFDGVEKTPLAKFYVLAKLQWAIGLAGSGQVDRGLKEVHQIITKYDEDSSSEEAKAYVTDARKAIGRIAALAGAELAGRDYYEGGLGFYAEGKHAEALAQLRKGVEAAKSAKERAELVPLCLDKIGEIHFLLEEYLTAANAYLEICRKFPDHPLAPKAANNSYAASTKLTKLDPAKAEYRSLSDESGKFVDELADNSLAPIQKKMADAGQLKSAESFADAKKIYAEIPRDQGGESIPFYWRAQAEAQDCDVQAWVKDKSAFEEDEILNVAAELEKIATSAVKDEQVSGAVLASFSAADVYRKLARHEKTVVVLRPFVDVYVDDIIYRHAALYYLVEALVELQRTDDAEKAFAVLFKAFPDKPSALYACLQLVDAFRAMENVEKAAEYILIWAKHPDAQEDLTKVRRLMDIFDVLVEAGRGEEAKTYLKLAEGKLKGASAELVRRVRWRSGSLDFADGHYRDAHESLIGYIEEFNPTGKDEDDPYILKMAGECLYQLNKKKPYPENRVSELKQARVLYERAMNIMQHRRKTDLKTSERMFWTWGYRWCQINIHLGREGEENAYRNVCGFVEENKLFAMGGPALKEYYLKIGPNACAKIGATTQPTLGKK